MLVGGIEGYNYIDNANKTSNRENISEKLFIFILSEEPERLPSGGRILLQKASVSGTHKDHKPVLRFSEPIMSTSYMKSMWRRINILLHCST